jgi:hypothetical protein
MIKQVAVKFRMIEAKKKKNKADNNILQLSSLSLLLDNDSGNKETLSRIDLLSQELSEHNSSQLKDIQVCSHIKWDLEGE